MTAVHNVLISGAGIAGPALARRLHHHGIEATVVERAPAPRSGGYAIDVRGVALDAAERMGVLDGIIAHRTRIATASLVDTHGRRVTGFSTSQTAREGRSHELLRGDLVRLLHEPTTEYTEYLYGDSITGMEQGPGGVRVTFERAEPRVFDLVVGADGLHSNTRRLAFGPEGPHRRFLESYISIFTVPNHLGLDREVHLYNLPGLGMGLYHTPRAEGAKALLMVRTDEETGIDRRTAEEQRRFLHEAFDGRGWESARVLSEMDRAPDFYFDSVTQVRMDRWSTGRITLLGDAGYCPSPMSGQGSSLAVVGAYVLAEELARSEDHTTALAAYEARMRPFADANQAVADAGSGFLAPRTRLGIAARNLAVRAAPLLSRLGTFDTRLARAAEALDLDAPAPVPRRRTGPGRLGRRGGHRARSGDGRRHATGRAPLRHL
ncbi:MULTISPECIES: FAD-dependent monooxygenase [unclassified Nocardiopsis]|uniref:FAD-dependent monooxygenase n=1 Tax=unclassified Nocardiopsis TaxID=2649073 RepID=UPI0009F8C76B|nr:FAD-dependent monooxygenase [Nocardiopsis sp. TSRI0078]